MKDGKSNKKVLVAMSGGIDSTVAAFLLKKQGYDCVGIALNVIPGEFEQEYGEGFTSRCNVLDLKAVKAICDHLKIPFFAVNAVKEYETMVLDRVIAGRLSGSFAPSCVFCNNMKFQVLFEKAEKLKASYIASGHFAKIHRNIETGEYQLYSSNDKINDQSHLLSDLDEDELSRIIFPLSDMRKEEVLKIAEKFNLPYIKKQKIQGTCLTQSQEIIPYVEAKSHDSLRPEGFYYNSRTNYQISDAEGIYKHFVGQTDLPIAPTNQLYDKNSFVVSLDEVTGEVSLAPESWLLHSKCKLNNIRFSSDTDFSKPFSTQVKFDEREPVPAIIYPKNNMCAVLEFTDGEYKITKGEFVTFYNRPGKSAKVVGSGIIEIVDDFEPIKRVPDETSMEEDEEGNIIKHPDKEIKF